MEEQIIIGINGTTMVAQADMANCRLTFEMYGRTYHLIKQPGGYQNEYRISRAGKMQREFVAVVYKKDGQFIATDTIHRGHGITPLQAATDWLALCDKYSDKRYYRYTN